jgi:Xaa-Pro aminopeptidase
VVAERGLDGLLVGDLVTPGETGREQGADIFWLTGFTGTSSLCVIGPESRTFFTDFRYTERAEHEVVDEFERVTIDRQLVPAVAGQLHGRIGFDEAKTSVKIRTRLEAESPAGVELVEVGDLIAPLRRTKDQTELRAMADAAGVADEAYALISERGMAGRTEREVARAAETRMRELGAEPAFPAIVAAGPNGAAPHHEAADREIGAGDLVVVDMGALVDGYCSDCTRTFAVGQISDEARAVYDLVARSQEVGLGAIGPGEEARAADATARQVIEAEGYGDRFGHGLGHGVGIQIHEAPTLNKRSEQTLAEGDVVTVEPGVYIPGELGVRIEDLVVVTDDGCKNLTPLPKIFRLD